MASLTRWTWVWVNSGSWWWTGRPGVLRFMGSQRVGHDWETDLIWLKVYSKKMTGWLSKNICPIMFLNLENWKHLKCLSTVLRMWFTSPRRHLKTLSGTLMSKNYFIKILRYFIFHCVDIFTDDAKTTVNLAVMHITRIIQWHPCQPFVTALYYHQLSEE